MALQMGIYRCEECGNIVEVLHGSDAALVCCGKNMTLVTENTVDAAKEKHVPVIEKTSNGYKITVGSVLHPMQEDHYIEWIALCADGVTHRKFLSPGDDPIAEFCVTASSISAHEYCNKHGLWKA